MFNYVVRCPILNVPICRGAKSSQFGPLPPATPQPHPLHLTKDVLKAYDRIRTPLSLSLSQQVDVLAGQVADAEAGYKRENMEESGAKLKELAVREDCFNFEVADTGCVLEEAQGMIDSHMVISSWEILFLNNVGAFRADEIPRIKHAISLYANLTNIARLCGGLKAEGSGGRAGEGGSAPFRRRCRQVLVV